MSEEETERRISDRSEEIIQRMAELTVQMRIPAGRNLWFSLALKLGEIYVPELKRGRTRGLPRKGDDDDLIRWFLEKDRLLNDLADRMGIPPGKARWFSLALKLGEIYAPELKTNRQDGAKKKWNVVATLVLVHVIALLMHVKRWTKMQACDQLAEQCPSWLPDSSLRRGGEAMARQCSSRALKAARQIVADAESMGKLQDIFDLLHQGIALLKELKQEKTEKSSA